MTILKVKAVGGVRVPYQHNARKYIEGNTVEVPNTAYYLRQIAAGDLIIVAENKEVAATEDTPLTETVAAIEPKAKTKAEASRGQS
ncbi:Uncharacterised protein [Yersinia mollaretii]|uniref:DUF2635 domain-containing protein n=1 Tax=Yersinia mollaretii TaxID=33060 RepID=UPI0005E066DD|nr:DUF2635 domain-containing protein [Yersinia mollaretii]CNJ92018.1 Uncharacterised protein [Yersinia mollaretii]